MNPTVSSPTNVTTANATVAPTSNVTVTPTNATTASSNATTASSNVTTASSNATTTSSATTPHTPIANVTNATTHAPPPKTTVTSATTTSTAAGSNTTVTTVAPVPVARKSTFDAASFIGSVALWKELHFFPFLGCRPKGLCPSAEAAGEQLGRVHSDPGWPDASGVLTFCSRGLRGLPTQTSHEPGRRAATQEDNKRKIHIPLGNCGFQIINLALQIINLSPVLNCTLGVDKAKGQQFVSSAALVSKPCLENVTGTADPGTWPQQGGSVQRSEFLERSKFNLSDVHLCKKHGGGFIQNSLKAEFSIIELGSESSYFHNHPMAQPHNLSQQGKMKCVLKTEEQKDWGAGLGNPIFGEDPVPGSAASVTSPASRDKVGTTVTKLPSASCEVSVEADMPAAVEFLLMEPCLQVSYQMTWMSRFHKTAFLIYWLGLLLFKIPPTLSAQD
ncbi:hypothetical protein EK904_012084 [Melospiza melodia maxima]|nr:hypothetical protein EK904_012084 [Melospiza melodia maxima]